MIFSTMLLLAKPYLFGYIARYKIVYANLCPAKDNYMYQASE